jgi:hypothetical protein
MNSFKFISLASQLLSLIDDGRKLDIEDTHTHIRNKEIFTWLQQKFEGSIDLSLHKTSELSEMIDFFSSLSQVVDERRTMGIGKNGLCLLVAYCLEGIGGNPETIQSRE